MTEDQPMNDEKQRHIDQTKEHRRHVRTAIKRFCDELTVRGETHDSSKVEPPEIDGFAKILKALESCSYGSPEYNEALQSGCIQAHYENNRHHPEHFEKGISGMHLIDVVEMFCDWIAACKRRPDGDIRKSVEYNKVRFCGEDPFWSVLANTANYDFGQLGTVGRPGCVYTPYHRGWMWALQDMAEGCDGALATDEIRRPEQVSKDDWLEFLRGYLSVASRNRW